jgi:hypothetical protein
VSIKSPSRRWGALLAGSAIVLSTAVVGLTGVAQAEPDTTASECTTEPTNTAAPTTTTATTPAETTPAETTPAETTPAGTTPAETTPAETTPAETTPAETTPAETTPAETTPAETTPAGTTPAETTPAETTPAETTPAETTPAETTPAETTPAETTPAETTPAETTPVETTPAETTPAETPPAEEDIPLEGGEPRYAFGASITQTLETFVEDTTCGEDGDDQEGNEETTAPATSTPATSAPVTSAPQTTQPETSVVVLPAVRDIKATVGTSSILVTWNAPADASGVVAYQAFANPIGAQSSGEMVACIVDADARSCRLGVEAGRAYVVGVFAIDEDAELGEAGDFVDTAVVPAPLKAATPPAGNTSLKKADGSAITNVTAGQTMTLRGEGYLPFSTVALYVYSEPTFLGNVIADKDGRFTVDVTIPASLAKGEHSLVASGVDFNGNPYVMRSDFTVAAAGAQSASLASTGASIALPLLGGLVAVGVGGGLLVSARRRSNA